MERATVPVDRLRPIIERAIAERTDRDSEVGGLQNVIEEIATTTRTKPDTVARRINVIMKGWDTWEPRAVKQPNKPAQAGMVLRLWEHGLLEQDEEGYWIWPRAGEAVEMSRPIKRTPITHVTFNVADTILTGLDLTYLWHTDLEDVYCDGIDLANAA